MPRLAQHPVALETMNLRRRLDAREGPFAEERPDRRDGHDSDDPPVREIGHRSLRLPVRPAIAAERGVLFTVAGAVAG